MSSNSCNDSNEIIDKIFSILRDGEGKIKSSENKNLVLVLGNVLAGKSAFTQWIAGDNSKLISKEKMGEFVIEDGNRIGSSTGLDSKTIFPELVENDGSAYYDCPGFDSKMSSLDLAKTYFIKKISESSKYSESIKIVFVINYLSVKTGTDQENFLKLIRHSRELLKDVNKFKESISIVASKVENQYVKDGDQLVSDSTIKKSIADYLSEIKKGLEKKMKVNSELDQKFCEDGIKFIDALLFKNGEDYAKIGLFRKPNRAGPLSDIELLKNQKKDIKKLIDENLKFTSKENHKFGYTLSENSKIEIDNLATEINSKISCQINNISNQAMRYYEDFIKSIEDKMNSFSNEKFEKTEINLTEANDMASKINYSHLILSNLIKDLNNLNSAKQLSDRIRSDFKKLGIQVSNDRLASIEKQDRYLDFLNSVDFKKFKVTKEFVNDLQAIDSFILQSKDKIKLNASELIRKIKIKIESEVEEIKKKMDNLYSYKLANTEIYQLLKETDELFNFALSVKLSDSTSSLKNFVIQGVCLLTYTNN